jgi:hypothetical protein
MTILSKKEQQFIDEVHSWSTVAVLHGQPRREISFMLKDPVNIFERDGLTWCIFT